MKREDIIRMAREAGFSMHDGIITGGVIDLERFADLVAAAERELRTETLALLQTIHMGNESKRSQDIIGAAMRVLQKHAPEELAAAIRARGNA